MRARCYIDGFNLYYGLKSIGEKRSYWLNVQAMAEALVPSTHRLTLTKYFTARISGTQHRDTPEQARERLKSQKRQTTFLEALGTVPALEIIEGKYNHRRRHCRRCNKTYMSAEEKMTDVEIASHLLTDAFLDRFELAIVVSGDSDLAPPVRMIRQHFEHKAVIIASPPDRYSTELTCAANGRIQIWKSTFRKCQLPSVIEKRDGTVLRKPTEWQ